ncbi:hypothetical protein HER14_19630 [Acidithiobacillus thiooxidans]|uniref:hypothetical protein n=1 Tax=Acidithiobacillus thiooxidans TaxID=930 RepID=UPI001C075F58|nr:hypothetical protein [Acidithiobacillus thiooxidans]MBU2753077.1 hypothetical protein [Acidithiobacillus thiooxidans]
MSELNDVAKKRVAEIGLEMVKRGLQHLMLEYDGSGDSQDDFVVSVQADNEEEFKFLESSDTLVAKLEDLVDAMHGGYENNAGGYGQLDLKIVDGTAILYWEHSERYEDSTPDDDAILDANSIEGIAEIIQPVARSCIITYVGGGDSMDGYEYTFMDENGKTVKIDDQELLKNLENVLDDMICNSAVSGFWDNDGGHGEIFIDSVDLEDSYWNHANYYTDSESSLYDFEVDLP